VTYFDSERQFTTWVLKEARDRGWLAAHFGSSQRIVRTKHGPMAVPDRDAAGFPDLVLVRERVVYAELKMHDRRSKPKPAQQAWLETLDAAGQIVYVWRPNDTAEILDVLDGATEVSTRLFNPEHHGRHNR
jgi:hypothetical protein